MTIAYNDAVIDFLISRSLSRAENGVVDSPLACVEGTAIFDELDSLTIEEFLRVYAVYLLGADCEHTIGDVEQLASVAGLSRLDEMASDGDLHKKLALGKERWLRLEKQG